MVQQQLAAVEHLLGPQQGSDWIYQYDLTGGGTKGGISDAFMEVTPGTTASDFWYHTGTDTTWHQVGTGTADLQLWWQEGNSDVGLPSPLYGIKIGGAGQSTLSWAIKTTDAPKWGDFYAQDGSAGGGGVNYVWNPGFQAGYTNTSDPSSALYYTKEPDSANVASVPPGNEILRPDGVGGGGGGGGATPELSSYALLIVGALVVLGLRRRRKTQEV